MANRGLRLHSEVAGRGNPAKEIVMRKLMLLVLGLVLVLTGCATTGLKSTDADVAAIRQTWLNYCAAVEKGDAAAWLSQWDKDGIQMRPDAPARSKSDMDTQVPGAFKARNDANDVKMAIDAMEIVVAGTWAYSRGVYTQDLKNKSSGQVVHVDGKFLTIFKLQQDGTWRIFRDCFNSNVPPK
jgi:ketosteroid isomerase-like protein